MATTRDPSPNGQIELIDYFYESSSGHVDNSRTVTLAADSNTLLKLTEFSDSCNQFSGPRTDSTVHRTIERDVLIDLIKKYGNRI